MTCPPNAAPTAILGDLQQRQPAANQAAPSNPYLNRPNNNQGPTSGATVLPNGKTVIDGRLFNKRLAQFILGHSNVNKLGACLTSYINNIETTYPEAIQATLRTLHAFTSQGHVQPLDIRSATALMAKAFKENQPQDAFKIYESVKEYATEKTHRTILWGVEEYLKKI